MDTKRAFRTVKSIIAVTTIIVLGMWLYDLNFRERSKELLDSPTGEYKIQLSEVGGRFFKDKRTFNDYRVRVVKPNGEMSNALTIPSRLMQYGQYRFEWGPDFLFVRLMDNIEGETCSRIVLSSGEVQNYDRSYCGTHSFRRWNEEGVADTVPLGGEKAAIIYTGKDGTELARVELENDWMASTSTYEMPNAYLKTIIHKTQDRWKCYMFERGTGKTSVADGPCPDHHAATN